MFTAAESDMGVRVPGHLEFFCVGTECVFIAVGRPVQHHHYVAFGDPLTANLDLRRRGARHVHQGLVHRNISASAPGINVGSSTSRRHCSGCSISAIMASATTSAERVSGRCRRRTNPVERSTQGADLGGLVFADDEIAFPVPGYGSIVGLGGPLGDVDHARDPAAAACARRHEREAYVEPAPCADMWSTHRATHRVLARRAPYRSFRGTPASPGGQDRSWPTPRRFARGCTS